MKKTVENEGRVCEENVFISDDHGNTVDGWYGLEYFEIHAREQFMAISSSEQFLRIYELMTEMKKSIEKLHDIKEE